MLNKADRKSGHDQKTKFRDLCAGFIGARWLGRFHTAACAEVHQSGSKPLRVAKRPKFGRFGLVCYFFGQKCQAITSSRTIGINGHQLVWYFGTTDNRGFGFARYFEKRLFNSCACRSFTLSGSR